MNQSLNLSWLFNKRFRLLYHFLFWMFIYSDELLSVIGVTEPMNSSLEILAVVLLDMATVYFNIYYLLPKLLFNNRIKIYVFWTVLTILLNVAVVFYYYNHEFFREETIEYWATMFMSSFLFTALMVGMAVGLKIFKFYISDQQKIQELKTINLRT